LRDSHKELSDGQGSVLQKYENEKALKERAQQMEDNERRERIAACAQLLAIQQHTETVIGSASATSDREVSELKSKLTDQKELIAELKVWHACFVFVIAWLLARKKGRSACDMCSTVQLLLFCLYRFYCPVITLNLLP